MADYNIQATKCKEKWFKTKKKCYCSEVSQTHLLITIF